MFTMKALRCGFALSILLIADATFANDAPPTDESLREMALLTHSQETYNSLKPQLDAMISSSITEVSRGKPITPERQAVIDRMRDKLIAAFNESCNADSMEMLVVRVYQATYTQDEVDGLVAFYKTPAGQALINKRLLLMQNMMGEMQAFIRPMRQRFEQIRRETEQEIRALPTAK
jgi:hypothetical protein